MKDLDKAVERYRAQLRRGATTQLDSVRANIQAARYAAGMRRLRSMEKEVRDLLCGRGEPVIRFPHYYAFARKIHGLMNAGLSGEPLAVEARSLTCVWVDRGLKQSALEHICRDVFRIDPPKPP